MRYAALVVANIIAYNNSIYRTQREKHADRQILPGYGVRRIAVPLKWDAKSLADLALRQRFDVNVIGWVEQEGDDGLPHVRLSADANRPLNAGDILVVLGTNGALITFREAVAHGPGGGVERLHGAPHEGAPRTQRARRCLLRGALRGRCVPCRRVQCK